MTHESAPATAQIIHADWMLTPAGAVEHAELAFDAAGLITYAGPIRHDSVPDLVLAGHALMPGLVNGHTHSAMTLLRGSSDDEGFMPWLDEVQALEQHLTHEDVAAGLQLAMLEMIESGTTTFADMYHWDAELLGLVHDAGMRVLAAPAAFAADAVAFPGVSPWTGSEALDQTEALAIQFADSTQIRLAYGPHAPYTCPPEFLREVGERALRSGLPVHIHISESAAEVEQIVERFGMTPADFVASLGLFNARVLIAHGVHLTPSELKMVAAAGAAISHNPVSNLKLGNGIAALPEWLASEIDLALGTDSVASNNTLDLFEEIKTGTIVHRGVHLDAAIVRSLDLIELATRRGAVAVGFPETGSLEAGRLADVIALDVTGASATPLPSLTSHIGFAARGADVRHVFIGGRHVYADGAHVTLDATAVRAAAAAASGRIRAAAGR